jgi:hypothetical protein
VRRNLSSMLVFFGVTLAKLLVVVFLNNHPYEEVAMNGLVDYMAHRSLELLKGVHSAPDSGAVCIPVSLLG